LGHLERYSFEKRRMLTKDGKDELVESVFLFGGENGAVVKPLSKMFFLQQPPSVSPGSVRGCSHHCKTHLPFPLLGWQRSTDAGSTAHPALQYYVVKSDYQDDVEFCISQLNLYRALTDGNFAEAEGKIREELPFDVLWRMLTSGNLGYNLRTAAVHVLFEVYLDSALFEGVPEVAVPNECFAWGEKAPLDAQQKGFQDLHLGYKKLYLQWFRAHWGAIAQSFSGEIFRLIEEDDEFEQKHQDHAAFLCASLQVCVCF
jgi:hypothetical protein